MRRERGNLARRLSRDRGKPPRARAIGVVFGAEVSPEQSLLGLDAGKHDKEHSSRDEDADAGAKRQSPAERVDQKAEIARMPNDAVNPAGDELDDRAGSRQGR